jgi:hypothetical protein
VLLLRSREHAREGALFEVPSPDRLVAKGLIDDEHERFRQIGQPRRDLDGRIVVLRESSCPNPYPRRASSRQERRIRQRIVSRSGVQQRFQARRPAGVVVDAQIVHHQGQWRLRLARMNRAKKTVLQTHERLLRPRGELLRALGSSLQAPTGDVVDAGGIARPGPEQDAARIQELLEPSDATDAG